MKQKGFFITFEGGEGSGKSTQIRYAAQFIRKKLKRKVLIVQDPGTTKIGNQIRSILLDDRHKRMAVETEMFLFLAARAQMVSEVIEPALKKGYIVISDRFEDSTIVYQGHAGGYPLSRIYAIVKEARGACVPDLTFYLDIPARVGLRRAGRLDRMERKSIRFHELIRKGFIVEAKRNRNRFRLVSSVKPLEKVRLEIEKILSHAIGKVN